jgi:hypothetical protein
MWRCLEVNFGIAAACLPTIYPGYRVVKNKFYSQRLGSTEKTEGKTSQLLLDPKESTRETRTTAAASTPGTSANLNITMPESAIVKSTRFGVRHGSERSDSTEEALGGNHSVLGHSQV